MNNGRPAEPSQGSLDEKKFRAGVRLLQLLFLLVSFWQLDQPLLTAHYERQNQTFDIARHVFREGWPAVITPTVAFTVADHEDQRSIAVLQEMPLHGILGWPLVKLFGHPYAVTRLVSVFFSLWSITLLFEILRFWVKPAVAVAGAAIWTFSPLLLQFGQVPMPDVICTAGILGAFLYAQRGNLVAASAAFLFAILAKSNSIVFGLPVLVALAVARNCRSLREFIGIAVRWGWAPLIGLVGWMALMKWFAPDAVWSTFHTLSDGRGKWTALVRMPYYLNVFGCMLPFGFGVLGTVGLIFCWFKKSDTMNATIKWAFYISSFVYLVFVIRKLLEPQYFLPLLAWALIAASIGWQWAVENYHRRMFWKWGVASAVIVHVIIALVFTADVKASRVPNYPDIFAASHLLKKSDRVLIFYRFYGASPAVWFDCPVLAFSDLENLKKYDPKLPEWGFTHVMLLDVSTRHSPNSTGWNMIKENFRNLFVKPTETTVSLSGFAAPGNPYHQYCDQKFTRIFDAPDLVLYSVPSRTNIVFTSGQK